MSYVSQNSTKILIHYYITSEKILDGGRKSKEWKINLKRQVLRDLRAEKGYLLFCGRTRKMTQYAATAVADIDPDGILRLRWNAQVIERSSWGSHLISHHFC